MNDIEQICNQYNVKQPELIINLIKGFSYEFNENDLLDSLSKIESIEDRIIYLEELAKLTKPDWESEIKPPEILTVNNLSNKYILDYKKFLDVEKRKQLIDIEKSAKKTEVIKINQTDTTQIGRPEDFPSKKTLHWYEELKENKIYQHKNGKPHKTRIKNVIIQRHGELHKDGHKPSMDTINTQFRKLGLTF